MTRETKEIEQIQQYLRAQIRQRMQELRLNPAKLANLIGSPRSTVSSIFDGSNNRLPHLYTFILIARALSLPFEELLPKNLVFFPEGNKRNTHSFISPEKLDIISTLSLIKRYNLGSPIKYHPRSIPEFCKSIQLLCHEYGLSEQAALDYREELQGFFSIDANGLIILEEGVLLDLIDRKGIFSESTRNDSLEMNDHIKKFQLKNSDRVTTVVANRAHWRVDPILIITKNLALADYFGSLLILSDVNLISHASKRFEAIKNESPMLLDWLGRV